MNKLLVFVISGIAAVLSHGAGANDDWRPMSSAPRDGTIIEIKNSYGKFPWYDIYHFGGKITVPNYCSTDFSAPCALVEQDAGPEWVSASRPGHTLSPADERYMQWRPYGSQASPYVDPTGGAQNTPEYWQRALRR